MNNLAEAFKLLGLVLHAEYNWPLPDGRMVRADRVVLGLPIFTYWRPAWSGSKRRGHEDDP